MPPYYAQTKRVPDVVRLGSKKHYSAVKCLYRRILKHSLYHLRLDYGKWDWFAMHVRNEFEVCRTMKEPGAVLKIMKDAEETLDLWQSPDPFVYPWDGPSSVAFKRYPEMPKKRFEHYVGATTYDQWWVERTTDEWFAKQEIEKWRARYITVFRDATAHCPDYHMWLVIKKRLEEELQFKIEETMAKMNVTTWDYYMSWPYNTIQQFSDGWKPDSNLDIAFQEHWDEDLWRHVAELTEDERKELEKYEWQDAKSLRTIDRYLER